MTLYQAQTGYQTQTGRLRQGPAGPASWLTRFDGPLVRGSGLGFEYQGDRDAMAWPPMIAAERSTGELGSVRFHPDGRHITRLTWSDWFGDAVFQRDA